MKFIVTEKAKRPITKEQKCAYCEQPIGTEHKEECVLIQKKVKVRMTIEYEIEVPASWDKDQIEFHRNESAWCASNIIDELKALDNKDGRCLCGITKFEYLSDTSEPYLSEN